MDRINNIRNSQTAPAVDIERFIREMKQLHEETLAQLPPEEQRELAERDAWVANSAGFQQIGESGE